MAYRVQSKHPEDDARGRVFAPGEVITDLDLEDPFNVTKIEEGVFIEVEAEEPVPPVVIPDSTEAAQKLAEEHQIDLSIIKGSGKNGRIVETDVEAAIEKQKEA